MGFCSRRYFFLSVCLLQMVFIHFIVCANCKSLLFWFSYLSSNGKFLIFWDTCGYRFWWISLKLFLLYLDFLGPISIDQSTSYQWVFRHFAPILLILFISVHSLAFVLVGMEHIHYLFIFRCSQLGPQGINK